MWRIYRLHLAAVAGGSIPLRSLTCHPEQHGTNPSARCSVAAFRASTATLTACNLCWRLCYSRLAPRTACLLPTARCLPTILLYHPTPASACLTYLTLPDRRQA